MTKVDRALALGNAQIAIANPTNPELLANGVRTSLQWFAEQNPGRAVEVRVPPYLAIQILGGNGYINDYPTGRLLRDAKLYEIGAGTSEIRRMLIGRELFEKTV